MKDRNSALASLYEWRNRAYFSSEIWEQRGLIKSPDPIPWMLSSAKNALVDELLEAIFSEADEAQLITIVLDHFVREVGSRGQFDTEEREFLGDCFCEIAASLELTNFLAALDARLSEGR